MLTTHLHLALTLRMSGAVPVDFMICGGRKCAGLGQPSTGTGEGD